MWWRRRTRTRPQVPATDTPDVDTYTGTDLPTVFLITVWLRQWADDMNSISHIYDRRNPHRQALEAIAAAVTDAAALISAGQLEPGGGIYERLTRRVPVER